MISYILVWLTFIPSKFGGRDVGFIPPKGEELWKLRLDPITAGAMPGGRVEQAVTELEEEEEGICCSV